MAENTQQEIKIKETEFDSSLAVLIRIDNLLKRSHDAALGINVPLGKIRGFYHLEILDRVYTEGYAKMTEKEIAQMESKLHFINKIINQYGNALYHPKNPRYINGWKEISYLTKQYERQLYSILDRHNMLMRDRAYGLAKFRGLK